ncbi:MAG: hypothetical protein ACI8P3_000588 [Saprospiraceae bacterium]|jgi:hypothetical protein
MPLRKKIQTGKPQFNPAGIDILRLDATKKALGYYKFPFSCKLSFVPLINHWKRKVGSGDAGEVIIAKEITRQLDHSLEFLTPFNSLDEIEDKRSFVELLLTGIFPSALRDQDLAFARKPFDPAGFYYTLPFLNLFSKEGLSFYINNQKGVRNATIIRACRMILNQFYGQRIRYDEETVLSMKTLDSPYEKHYKLEYNTKFVEIKKLKPLKTISQEEVNLLLSDFENIDLWLQYIPATHFEFQGMVSVTLIDVTEGEAMSRLKKILLNKNAVVEPDSILQLEMQLCTYFGINELVMGLVAIDYPVGRKMPHRYKINHSLLHKKLKRVFSSKHAGSIYETACKLGDTLIIEDLEKYPFPTTLEKHLLKSGLRSVVIVPLLAPNNQVIGILELGSPKAYDLNSFVRRKLREVQPLFRTVLGRSRQEIDNEVEAIIRDRYTALHPSVEWKFVDAAFKLIAKRKKEGKDAMIDPIIFKEVYPLYGQADIVGSTNIRNNSIQEDFADNLSRIKKILGMIDNNNNYPIVESLKVRLDDEIEHLESGVLSDQEIRTSEFIKNEVYPFFVQFKNRGTDVEQELKQYFADLDDELNIIYNKRKDYEQSVQLINKTIGDYLSAEDKRNQTMLPHYFELSKTDGVEYNIYIGQSLLKGKKYDQIHLQNLRLWQLVSMCEITREIEALQKKLPISLYTAQLILVHSTPLTIKFRMDEKQFDVDGTFNIRYPILKKRIDKAFIEGTGERLTQKGKIAIVYAQEKDRLEYEKYIEYLLQKKFVTEDIEYVSLGNTQGIQGLKALRLKVKV